MNILPLSDLHLEFHPDHGRAFVAGQPEGVDVLILAGDIATQRILVPSLRLFCKRFPAATVLYVHGNHEFYGSDRKLTVEATKQAVRENSNLRWLDCTTCIVDGVRFHGTPLWFRDAGERDTWRITDFKAIRDYRAWVYNQGERAAGYLRKHVLAGDVVVTHHLPTPQSVAVRYRGSPLNAFFLHDVGDVIDGNQPGLWIHGHTHDSFDYRIGGTRIVCNPHGYHDHANRNFDPVKLICGRCKGDAIELFADGNACRC